MTPPMEGKLQDALNIVIDYISDKISDKMSAKFSNNNESSSENNENGFNTLENSVEKMADLSNKPPDSALTGGKKRKPVKTRKFKLTKKNKTRNNKRK
jgi:hypothetical protein